MEKLKQVLAQEDTVLFIGSGISLWSGLPSWPSLIEELVRFVESAGAKVDLIRAEAQKGDLLQAASYGFDKLTKQQTGEFIRAACRYGVAEPHEIHRKIVSLGPRCFVTTNYDNLIEESLRKWQPDRFFRPPVTNRHLTETAEIVHARAIDFIFKPHGDAGDSESIILTREQYRQLLPQGERQAALESLKMLLASRPVAYLGFGLRDPDFIYVRDLLANTYKGGTRDHYAIMADISDAEGDYWRRNYGIHLISYATTERPDKTKDHTALLTLLDTLLERVPASPSAPYFNPSAPDVVLALARHAAALARYQKIDSEFQIRVHTKSEKREARGIYNRPDRFDHCLVEEFLDDGPERALLIGLPGAGKTYSLHRTAARLADSLNEVCLSEPFDEKAVIVPILADFKLYRGNLHELVSQMLPKSLPLDEVTRHYKVKFFLDSFNEIPREYLESGFYESDIAKFLKRIGDASLLIGSRTSDGLDKLGLPAYHLDQIDKEAVTAKLRRLGIEIEGRFDREVLSLLQRPFYFKYVTSGAVKLDREIHPRTFYQSFFENLREAFVTRFGGQLDIGKALSLTAYDALNRGEEAFPLSELLRALRTSAEAVGLADMDVRDVANWLVSHSVLLPYTGGRVAFVHQSVTEYLAATELVRRYQASPSILKEKLSLTRWDQALFLTLSLLPSAQAEVFLHDVIKADFVLALNAAKYLEEGRDEVLTKLLSAIPERMQALESHNWKVSSAIEFGLPLTDAHESQLRTIIKSGGSIGAAAVMRLIALKGAEVKDEFLKLLVDCCADSNFCIGIGRALKPLATDEDAIKVATWADSIQEKLTPDSHDDDIGGFTSGAATFLSGLDLSTIQREFLTSDQSDEVPRIHARILCNILEKHHTTVALNLAGELLLRGVNGAEVAIYFISKNAKSDCELSWDSFTEAHVNCLETILKKSSEFWALHALEYLCAARPDLAEVVKQRISNTSGIEKAALLYCLSPSDCIPVFQALGELTQISDKERREQPIQIFRGIQLDWEGKEELFVKLLMLRDMQLASALMGYVSPPLVLNLGKLEVGPIEWWLEWVKEVGSTADGYFFLMQLGSLFAQHLNQDAQDRLVAEFNKSGSKFRRLLLHFVLPDLSDITTEVFSEDAISFLLADLTREGSMSSFRNHLLAKTATEQFVTERLLPLLPDAKQPLVKNLHSILEQVGSRHGRRYILE